MSKKRNIFATMEEVGKLVKAQVSVTPSRVAKNCGCSHYRAAKHLTELQERNFLNCQEYGYRKNVLARMYTLTLNGERLMKILEECSQQELPF